MVATTLAQAARQVTRSSAEGSAAWPRFSRRTRRAALAAVAVASFLALLNKSMNAPLSHDEHQFIASAELLLRDFMLPYRDFPYFHTPNQSAIYAVAFAFTDRLLLSARVVATVSAWVVLLVVFRAIVGAGREDVDRLKWVLAFAGALLVFFNPLFAYTSGLAWNHDLSVLLALLAFVTQCQAIRSGSKGGALLSGVLLGLAAGTRLTFAPLTAAFMIAPLLWPARRVRAERVKLVLAFCLGGALALLPVAALAASAPEGFWFGNVAFRRLNAIYFQDYFGAGADAQAMSLLGKVRYALREVIGRGGNLVLFFLFTVVSLSRGLVSRFREDRDLELGFVLLLLPFLFLAALAPVPSWYQYYYAFVPFLALGTACGLLHLQSSPELRAHLRFLGTAVVVAVVYGVTKYPSPMALLNPAEWVPNRVHAVGEELARNVGSGKVLTLAPLFPLEGGLDIYHELASGPFVWRIGHLMTERERESLHVISEEKLMRVVESDPPAAILVGYEPWSLEKPLQELAEAMRFRAVALADGANLYVDPRTRAFGPVHAPPRAGD